MAKEVYLTQKGLEDLKIELEDLKMVKRPKIIEALKEARALGDLSENAEYDAARNEQATTENRIREIEIMLENAVIIEESKSDKVKIGSRVTIEYIDDNEKEEYSIVGSTEADPFANKISNESPIALAIMDKKVGDVVVVSSPNGEYKVRVKAIA